MATYLKPAIDTLVYAPANTLGLDSPLKRFAVITITDSALYLSQPECLFNSDGTARSWKVTSADDRGAVWFPWYLVGPLAFVAVETMFFL